jgi:hypothetical protein
MQTSVCLLYVGHSMVQPFIQAEEWQEYVEARIAQASQERQLQAKRLHVEREELVTAAISQS